MKTIELADILENEYINKIVNSNVKNYEADEEDCFNIAESIIDDIPKWYNARAYIEEYLEKNEWFDIA